jgi:hypothetical protein
MVARGGVSMADEEHLDKEGYVHKVRIVIE